MKRIWKEIVLMILVIIVSVAISCSVTNLIMTARYGDPIVHDNGYERIMTVYSYSGEELAQFTGFISVMKSDGNVATYDHDGGCISVQGGIVIVEDIY